MKFSARSAMDELLTAYACRLHAAAVDLKLVPPVSCEASLLADDRAVPAHGVDANKH